MSREFNHLFGFWVINQVKSAWDLTSADLLKIAIALQVCCETRNNDFYKCVQPGEFLCMIGDVENMPADIASGMSFTQFAKLYKLGLDDDLLSEIEKKQPEREELVIMGKFADLVADAKPPEQAKEKGMLKIMTHDFT